MKDEQRHSIKMDMIAMDFHPDYARKLSEEGDNDAMIVELFEIVRNLKAQIAQLQGE